MPALRVSLVAWLVFVSLPEQQRPGSIFRAETRTVMVNVAVFDRSGFIEGLGTKDFLVTDNGVNQTVVKVEMTSMNLDVVVATDQSGSLPQATASQLARDAHAVIELVGANDTLRQLTFDRDVRTTPLPPRPSTEGYVPRGDGGTALFDAITAAVLVAPDPTRQRLAIVLTDGVDNVSAGVQATRLQLMRRSTAVLYVAAFSRVGRSSGMESQYLGPVIGDPDRWLRQLSEASGGEFVEVRPGATMLPVAARAADRMRKSYVLHYQPTGADQAGWHDIVVRIAGRSATVLSKRGYFR